MPYYLVYMSYYPHHISCYPDIHFVYHVIRTHILLLYEHIFHKASAIWLMKKVQSPIPYDMCILLDPCTKYACLLQLQDDLSMRRDCQSPEYLDPSYQICTCTCTYVQPFWVAIAICNCFICTCNISLILIHGTVNLSPHPWDPY